MIKLFEFNFLDRYNKNYTISIYDSESDVQGEVKTAKLYGQDGCILNYEKENTDYVVGGIIKSDLTFSVLNENGILNNFIKNLQLYENRYLVELKQVENIKFRGILLNDFGTFEDNKIQVIEFQATDGLGLLQNIDYVDDIQIGNSIDGYYDSWAFGNGIIDVISRALSFNPTTKFFQDNEWYISYKTDYKTADMLQDWDALNYTNVLKRRDDVTYYVSPFADYETKKTLSGVEYKVYEYKNCYDVIDSCLKLFNLCLVQDNGVWNIFSIKYLEENKDNYNYFKLIYANNSYYKNFKIKDEYQSNISTLNINNNEGYRGSGSFSLNTVIKKIEQKFIPFYVKEGVYNNLIYSGNHGGDLQWYSYPAGVITGFTGGKTIKESNFDNWSLCSKYHYHNFVNAGDSISNLQFLINFTIKYAHENWSGHRHIQNAKLKMDLNLNVNGKWLDNNGNWVDSLPASNWWHQFSSVVDGYDGDVVFNFNKYFAVGIPYPGMGCGVDFYFRIYEDVNLTGYDSFTKIANIQNNSVLKLVDVNGNDIEYIDYIAENGGGILDIELDESFVDNFSESAANNVLLVATNELSNNVYYYEKSDKWLFEGESIYDMKNLTEKRLSEIAAMNSHPLLKWEGNIYYKIYTDINYLQLYLIRYNLALQHYVMFPQRITFYIRKMMATAELIEISRDFLSIASGGNLQVGKYNVPHSDVPGVINNEVTDVVANQISIVATGGDSIMRINNVDNKEIYKVIFDDINNKIVVNDNENDLLTIDNTGIHYINEKTAGNGIEIDSNNKINVKIDNDTIKLNTNNELYANVTGFDINEFLQKSFAVFLQRDNFEKVAIGGYNLLNDVIQQLSSVFFNVSSGNITLDLSSLDNYANLQATIEETIDINYELNDVIYLAQGQNINVFNFADNQAESYIQRDFYIDKLYFCKERNYFNKDEQYFNLLFYRDTDNNYIINTINNTWIQANHYIVYNNLFVYTDSNSIYSVDIDGNTNIEANLQIDGFFIYANTLYAYSENDSKTYKRSYNGVWSVYDNVSAVRKIINMYNVNIIAVGDLLDICVYKDKVYGIKSDGIYVYTQGGWLLVNNNVANLTKMQATEKYIYLLDNGHFRYFDGNFIHDTHIQCTDFVAVETDDCILRLDNYYFNGHLSNIQKIQHSANYNYNLYADNYYVFNMNIKNITIKNEIKKIENL